MRVVFLGVASIGWHCLEALLESGAEVVGIFSADKASFVRATGMHPSYFSEFEAIAEEHKISLYKIASPREPLDARKMRLLEPDLLFCIGWPPVVKKDVLSVPQKGCLAIHPSLLPQRRGGSHLNWCLIDGLTKGGVTLFYMEEEVDKGEIVAQGEFEITLQDDIQSLIDKATAVSVGLIRAYYPLLERGTAPRIPQKDEEATYTRRRRPEQGVVDWKRTSLALYNWVRALTLPYQGAFTFWKGIKVILWQAELVRGYKPLIDAIPGQILEVWKGKGIVIATADSCILIRKVQVEGENKAVGGDEFVLQYGIPLGTVLGGR